ncbi:MAG: DUF1353 domain-containing protein [Pseudomonadota bacterium]
MPPRQDLPVPDPYPGRPVAIKRLVYRESLVLLRLKDAVKTRSGEDANFILGADYRVAWTDGKEKDADGNDRYHEIIVPRGMLTDLASVPPIFRSLVGRVGPWLEAAVVHDFLTIAWRVIDGEGSARRRRFADDIMLAAMREAKVGELRKWSIYAGIRALALVAYPQKAKPAPWSNYAADLGEEYILQQLAKDVHLPQ